MMKTRVIWDMWLCLLVNVSDHEDVNSKLLQNISSYLPVISYAKKNGLYEHCCMNLESHSYPLHCGVGISILELASYKM